jgi:hypothetical protein
MISIVKVDVLKTGLWVPHKQTNNKQTLSKFIQIREFTEYSAVVEMASESFIISKKLGVETRAN